MATLQIKRSQGNFSVSDVNLSGTVAELKAKISAHTSIAADSQSTIRLLENLLTITGLVFGGRVLEDSSLLSSYNIADGGNV